MQTHKITLQSKKFLTKDVIQFQFSKPEGFEYIAGQFVQFQIPSADKFILRSYSLSSGPRNPDLEFLIKLLPDGKGTQFLNSLAIGQEATIQGPNGRFVVDETQPEHVFIATGVGLAPILSMIRTHAGSMMDIRLLFGVRNQEDIFWLEGLQEIKYNVPSFIFDITLSKPDSTWTGLSGRVTDHLANLSRNAVFYLCGSAEMVKDVRAKLLADGVPTQKIKFEIF